MTTTMPAQSSSSVPLMMDIEGGEVSDEDTSSGSSALGAALKNDFAFNNNVAGAAKHIRMGFLRKVYGLLSVQLLMTTLIAGVCLMTPALKEGIHAHPELILVAFFLAMGLLVALHIKSRETPLNLILLAAFTVVEAYTVGVIVTFYDVGVVVQAFFLTAGVVVGLTLFTFQTKRDFTGWGTGLFTGLWVLILGGFMLMFLGGDVAQLALAVGGALLFSAFIVYDTQMIMTKVNPEDYIVATIQLYLDIINLFIEILKILDRANRR